MDDTRDASAVPCGNDYVRIRKDFFAQAVAKMKSQAIQLKAAENVHLVVRDKDEALRAAEEKYRQLRMTVKENEDRQAARLSLMQKNKSSLEADSAVADIEVDCAPAAGSDNLDYFNPPPKRTDFRTLTPATTVCPKDKQTADSLLQSASIASSVTTPTTSSRLCSIPSGLESRDLVEKLSQQNARLKKAIRDVLAHQGTSVAAYLDKQEYEDAADMLRRDYKHSQAQVERLKAIIKSRDSGELDQLSNRCLQLEETLAQANLRYTILKAYADTVQQAHDRPVKEQKATSSSSSATQHVSDVSSSDYTKLMGNVPKSNSEPRSCDKANRESAEQVRQLTADLDNAQKEIEELVQKCSNHEKLEHDFSQLLEDYNVLKSQVGIYQEDFTLERKEKMELKRKMEDKHAAELQEQKKRFEQTLLQHQEWVRRLSVETQNCRSMWNAEKSQREMLEQKLRTRFPGAGGFALSCQREVLNASGVNAVPSFGAAGGNDIVEDGTGSQQQQRPGSLPPSVDAVECFTCPRCERTFATSEAARFQQHLKRCQDD